MNEIKFNKNWFLNCYVSKHTAVSYSRQVYFVSNSRQVYFKNSIPTTNSNILNDYFKFTLLPNHDYIAELLESAIKENEGFGDIRRNSNFIIANELILKFIKEQGWIEE